MSDEKCRCPKCDPSFRVIQGQCVFCDTKGPHMCKACLTKALQLLGNK